MKIKDRKGSENGVADHLSSQALLQVHDIKITPWYADMVNYLVIGNLPFDLSKRRRNKLKVSLSIICGKHLIHGSFALTKLLGGVSLMSSLSMYYSSVMCMLVVGISAPNVLLRKY